MLIAMFTEDMTGVSKKYIDLKKKLIFLYKIHPNMVFKEVITFVL